ncbi:MAG: DGQHR domain-containing protein [Sphingopyxis sp.]|nr:DGQHR domain-containing protein [Sphingopyxis sp.]
MLNVAEMIEDVMLNENVPEFDPPEAIGLATGLSLKSGVQVVSGLMPLGVILDRYEIPYYDGAHKGGYQRLPQQVRVNRLANDLRRGTDTPTAVLLNIRECAPIQKLFKNGPGAYEVPFELFENVTFHVVDGQHRILGYEKAINDGWFDGLQKLIPFTCMLGADEAEEMQQFYTVNSTAKSVRTDLAYALLARRIENEDDLLEAIQGEGKDWQIEGQRIVEALSQTSKVWAGRIKLPGMNVSGSVMPSASMVTSLKKIIQSPFFARLDSAKRTSVIDAYWEGIREALPEAFKDPKEFSIQKGIGVSTMHEVLPEVIELLRINGSSVTDPEAYREVMVHALNNLSGENQLGVPVEGLEFWRAGEHGAAGSYSSGAGKRLLAVKLKSELDQIN